MTARIPEANKQPGVRYAFTEGGVELPIIDITHPSFHLAVDAAELEARAQRFSAQQAKKGAIARWLERVVLPMFLRRSVIGRGMLRSTGTYLDGLSTYLMKLGPNHLGAWATKMDRKMVEGMDRSGFSLGLRVQDMAELLADALGPLLAGGKRPLRLINIAGGPSMDSLNALILLQQRDAAALAGRGIAIDVFDAETEGVTFAAAALRALQEEGGPLHGVAIALEAHRYDWNHVGALSERLGKLPGDAIVAASSEGGLFDYGTDEAVLANLKAVHTQSPGDALFACTISRPDGTGRMMRRGTIATLVMRELEALERLAQQAGFGVRSSRARPVNRVVMLEKR